jgi:fucose permease
VTTNKMLDDHGDFRGRSESVLSVTIVFVVLCTIFVGLRMVSRAAIVKKVTLDDYFIVLAWAIAVGLSSAICFGCAWGLGRHEHSIPDDWQETLRKANYVFSVLYQPALMATKTSILAFYLSLPTSNKNFKWACIGTLVVVNAGGIALGLFTVAQCRPVGAAFEYPLPKSANCSDIISIYLSSTPLNLITDLAILFLPIPILTGMRLPKKQKIILLITFSFGAFVAVVDVVRIVYLQGAARTRLREISTSSDNGTREAEQTDFSWYASFSFMWSAIEVNVGIMCACVPGLKPLVSRFLPRLLRDVGDATSKNESFSDPVPPAAMQQVQRVPSLHTLPEDVQRRDFSVAEAQNREEEEPQTEGSMGMMDFLTTPDMNDLPPAERTQTALTNTSRHTQPGDPNFFDFVNMKRKKGLVYLTTRESIFPIAVVTVIFFIWGFEYGLLDVLNQQFQQVAHMTPGQSTGIHSAYFAGYFFGPTLVGHLVLKHWGFKACFTVGLSIYACGTLIFWPAAVLTSFPAFVITNFIVAFGLSILEVAANPFIALCGPPEYSEMRLNLSQAIQAIGSIVAPLIADKAFVTKASNAPSLVETQWAYLGISLFTVLLAVAYYYIPLPEVTDEELEDASERLDGANKAKIGNIGIVWITLGFGVFSQFCYVGGQEVNGTNYSSYLGVVMPSFNAADYTAIAHTAFALARFLAAGLGFWVKPRLLLLFFYVGAIIFGALAMSQRGGTGVAMIVMVLFFEGPIFALIFAQSLRGMGRNTKFASVLITAAVGGGSIFSPISNDIAHHGRGPTYAVVVGLATFAAGTVFPIWLNVSPLARKQCDPIKDVTLPSDSRPGSNSSRASKALSFLHLGTKRESPNTEWRERKSNDLSPVRHGLA